MFPPQRFNIVHLNSLSIHITNNHSSPRAQTWHMSNLCRGVDLWRTEPDLQFFLDWRAGEAPPEEADIVNYTQPLHLRVPMNLQSFGHLIRDNIHPLVNLALRFGREPVDFDWVSSGGMVAITVMPLSMSSHASLTNSLIGVMHEYML